MQSFAKWDPSKDWHFMHRVGSGSSFRTGQRGPRMTSPFLIALFASSGLKSSMARCALRCLGFLLSTGLIHLADLIDPVGSELLRSMSLRAEGSSVLNWMGTNSTRMGKGFTARETFEPNLDMKALVLLVVLNQSAVSIEFASYKMWPWAVFLAERNSASSGMSELVLQTSLRVTLAFSTRTSSLRSLKEAVGLLGGGEILMVLVCAKHFAVAIEGNFCRVVSA